MSPSLRSGSTNKENPVCVLSFLGGVGFVAVVCALRELWLPANQCPRCEFVSERPRYDRDGRCRCPKCDYYG